MHSSEFFPVSRGRAFLKTLFCPLKSWNTNSGSTGMWQSIQVGSCSRFLPCFAACMNTQLHSRTPQISQPDPCVCNLPLQMQKPKTYPTCSPCPPARSINIIDHLCRSCAFELLKVAFQERWQLQLPGSAGRKHFGSWWQLSRSIFHGDSSLTSCYFTKRSHLLVTSQSIWGTSSCSL